MLYISLVAKASALTIRGSGSPCTPSHGVVVKTDKYANNESATVELCSGDRHLRNEQSGHLLSLPTRLTERRA